MMGVVDCYDMINPYEVELVEFENYYDNMVEIDWNMMMMVVDHKKDDHYLIMVIHENNFHYYVHASMDCPLIVKVYIDLYEILEFYFEQSIQKFD